MAYESERIEYDKIRMQIDDCDLIEFAGDSFIPSGLIRMRTGLPVNHSAIVVKMRIGDDWDDRRYIYEADENGFHPTYLSNKVSKYKGKIYLYHLNNYLFLEPDLYGKFNKKHLAKCITELEGIEYDWISLFMSLLKRRKLNADKLYCSEAIQWSMLQFLNSIGMLNCYEGLKLHNNGYGLWPGELHKTGLWGNPIRIK